MAANSGETYEAAFPPDEKPYISYGLPFPETCAHHVDNTYKASKVYIIVSKSISQTENFTRLTDALGDKVAGVRKGIKAHTPWDDVIEIVKDFKEKDADLLVTLGAGSLTDGAKLITLAAANDATETDTLSKLSGESKPATIPIINIPTSLSGGEYSIIAGATDTRSNRKVGFIHPSMGTSLVILDPALSISTPARIWLSTGIRAVDHCVEALVSLHENASRESDERALRGLRMLIPNLLATKKDWEALEPRMICMLGVVEALWSVIKHVPMGASHGIGHQLGPLGVGHGETSCIMLPYVLKWTWREGDAAVRTRQMNLKKVLLGEAVVKEVLEKSGLKEDDADLGDILGAVFHELGMPRTLKDVGVGKEKLDALAENSLQDPWLETNPVPITEKSQVLQILDMALGESTEGYKI